MNLKLILSAQIMFGRLQANLAQDRYLCNAKRLKLLTSFAYAKHLKRKSKLLYDLHDALLAKSGNDFWKSWHSKCGDNKATPRQVNGVTNDKIIVSNFAEHLNKCCSPNSGEQSDTISSKFANLHQNYCGLSCTDEQVVDAALVDKIIRSLKDGKAAGLDSLTAEHLKYSHPALATVLAKLFNIMLIFGCLPAAFRRSYTVPLPKGGHAIGKCLTVEDFRSICISSVLSKIFEHCLLDLYATFFTTSDNQFGFKKRLSCSNAIYSIRTVIDRYIEGGSTVSLCALDLSKAFEQMNRHALLIKLMNRQVPINLLEMIENWFDLSCTCIKWGAHVSNFIKRVYGVRQGGAMSLCLFAIFIDDIVTKLKSL